MDEDSKVESLRRKLLKESKPSSEKRSASSVVSITGHDGIVIGDNNTINFTGAIHPVRLQNVTVIDPNGGELTPHQKQRLKSLVNGVVLSGKKSGLRISHQSVWSRFQRRFKVNTYHALRAADYQAAKKYLTMLYGRAKKGAL